MKRNFGFKSQTNFNPGTPSFWGNSATEWVGIRDKIIAQFQGSNCWDMVDPDLGWVEELIDGVVGKVRYEVSVDCTQPNRNELVTKKLKAFDKNIEDWFEKSMKQVVNLVEPELSKRTQIIEMTKLEKEFGRIEKKDNLEYRFGEAERAFATKQAEYVDKVSRVLKVFHQCFRTRPLAIIENELDSGKFRTAWDKLNATFLTQEAESQIIMVSIEGLHNLKYEESQGLEVFIQKFNQLYQRSNQPEDDFTKVGYFKNCLEKSRSNPFRETLSFLNLQGFTKFDNLVEILFRKEMENRTKRNFQKVYNSKESVFQTLEEKQPQKKQKVEAHLLLDNPKQFRPRYVCTHCKLPGHTVDRCFLIVACSKCGELGHSPKNCTGTGNMSSNGNGGPIKKNTTSSANAGDGRNSSTAALKIKEKFVRKNPFPKKGT